MNRWDKYKTNDGFDSNHINNHAKYKWYKYSNYKTDTVS